MGLTTGEHGVKQILKNRFPGATKEFETLKAAREGAGFKAEQTVVCLDGNVLSNQIPIAVRDIDGYVRILSGFVNQAFAAGNIVIVVFDEAKHLTLAKKAEQDRRDASRKKGTIQTSTDLESFLGPKDDDFGLDDVENVDPHAIMRHRGTRGRMYDWIWGRVMRAVEAKGKTLVFDGIDASGIDRPKGTPREQGIVSTDPTLEPVLAHVVPIGEGDLKLTDTACVVQEQRDAGLAAFQGIELILISTIDTDSLALELINEAAKSEERRLHGCSQMRTLLAFKEQTGKRGTDDFKSLYACFDLSLLLDQVLAFLFGKEKDASAHLHRCAIALLSMAWTLCGSDFVSVKGMRPDVATDICGVLCKTDPQLLLPLSACWELKRDDAEGLTKFKRDACAIAGRLVSEAGRVLGSMPRMARSCASLRNDYSNTEALKASWLILYWHSLELKEVDKWGF
jgi:hypothetical protein